MAAPPRSLRTSGFVRPLLQVRQMQLEEAVGHHRPHDRELEHVHRRHLLRRLQQPRGRVSRQPSGVAIQQGRHEGLEASARLRRVLYFDQLTPRLLRMRTQTDTHFCTQWVQKPAVWNGRSCQWWLCLAPTCRFAASLLSSGRFASAASLVNDVPVMTWLVSQYRLRLSPNGLCCRQRKDGTLHRDKQERARASRGIDICLS
mmetsp:Transcript_23812/g.52065  ORF Transcript_23812/g.52065 Transcript_23812/m.52065 type:complete len:202 (-) Transcript_23812:106-711(-)